jgi:glycosyltransferase involved in cell wall biosynthesis
MKKLNILMLSWEYPPHVVGGLGAHVAALAPALVRAGVQVHLVTPRWKGGEEQTVIPGKKSHARKNLSYVYRVNPPVMRMGNFFADVQQTNLNLQTMAEQLTDKFGGFDLIHAHDWLVAFAAAGLKKLRKIPLLATIHATERGRGRGFLGGEMSHAINGTEWWLTYEAWRVITCSQYMSDQVKEYFNTPPDKIDVIPNGVDTTPFDELDQVDLTEFRARWALPNERIVFNVGRVVEEKGAHLIVEAAPRVLTQLPNTKFIIAGTGSLVERLRQRTHELGIADHVLIAGFISDSDRNRLLKVADAAIFPSLYEPFGIVALEAMAAKCPVIVSEVGGLKEVVKHDVTGVTIYPGNVESTAWGIVHTLSNLQAARARARKAYRIVKRDFNWDRIAELTIAVYERIIRERAKVHW